MTSRPPKLYEENGQLQVQNQLTKYHLLELLDKLGREWITINQEISSLFYKKKVTLDYDLC